MAKKDKTVYAPGELGRVRDKLGDLDHQEARRMMDVLGGEVGYERSEEQANLAEKNVRYERVDVKIGNQPGRNPGRRVELAPDEEEGRKKLKGKKRKINNPADDPMIQFKANYFERVKMDRFAGQSQFDIKSAGQVLHSMFALFGDVPDYINPHFITKRMKEYYRQLENLVVSTRSMLPRNNAKRNERLKKTAPLAFRILDTIRHWDIEKISSNLAMLQAKPKNVKVEDFSDILRAVYKPLFILDLMDMDDHIRGAYKVLYKALYIENPMEAHEKYQEMIRSALASYADVRREIRHLMYPLLMKAVSANWLSYDNFFTERRNRIMALLDVSEDDQIDPTMVAIQTPAAKSIESISEEDLIEDEEEEKKPQEQGKKDVAELEKKALDRGLNALEALFPKAGWDRLDKYPDLYPYFVDIFGLPRGLLLMAPTDPLQQIFILTRVLEELFFGLRYVTFSAIPGIEGGTDAAGEALTEIINNWQYHIQHGFEKEYIPRLTEYVRLLEGTPEDWNSPYTKKVISDLHWIKRLYFLPYYKFQSLNTPSFHKRDIDPIYPNVKKLRRYLAAVAIEIEKGNRAGGAKNDAHCEGIENPWAPYAFQVPNPVSTRLNALLAEKNRTNASLIFFTLATVTVLDFIVNNEASWAYAGRPGPLFRSEGGDGITPQTGIDEKIDANALFKASIKKRQQE